VCERETDHNDAQKAEVVVLHFAQLEEVLAFCGIMSGERGIEIDR
jgi:hypothetical protein